MQFSMSSPPLSLTVSCPTTDLMITSAMYHGEVYLPAYNTFIKSVGCIHWDMISDKESL